MTVGTVRIVGESFFRRLVSDQLAPERDLYIEVFVRLFAHRGLYRQPEGLKGM